MSNAPATSNNQKLQLGPILLAEDNLANQKLMTQQLDRLGYSVDVASNGAEAIKLWELGDYKLLLTDCDMPIMDGFALTKLIREKEQLSGKHISIIAVTANAMQGEAEKCLNSGMDDYLPKPIRMKDLKDILELWFQPPEAIPRQ